MDHPVQENKVDSRSDSQADSRSDSQAGSRPDLPEKSAVRWYLCTALLILLWAFLLFYVQSQSFRPGFAHGRLLSKALCRGALDLLFASSCVLLIPRGWVPVPILLASASGLGLIVYARYFGETMSILSLFANFDEGLTVSDAVIALLPPGPTLLVATGALMCVVLVRFAGNAPVSYRTRLKAGMTTAALYFLIVVGVSQCPGLAFSTLVFSKETGDLVVVYGYLPTWVGELCVKDEGTLRDAALAQPRTDRLTGVEFPLPLPRQVLVIQVETLDYTIIDREFGGKTVTPFLNALKKRSFFYKVDSFHYHGSADADFAFLASREPSRHLLNYKIRTFPYDNTLPRAFEEHGYRTHSFHGVSGTFFNRVFAYRKMGFSDILFIDDLVARYGVEARPIGGWTATDDERLLDILGREILAEKDARGFFFAITLLGHAPFTHVREREIVPEPKGYAQRYMNVAHEIDRRLGRLYDSLPPGTMFVVYGDHSSGIESDDYTSRRANERDYVPCFLSIVGESIAEKQKTAGTPSALGGELTLVDISNYLRSLLPDSPAAASGH